EQPYLNSDLRLTTLAEEMSVSSNLLSQAINQNSEENFSGLINRYRIEHAKELLRLMDPSSDKTIFEIAMDSGFNTKSSFNRNFKEYTGQTPSSYRDSVQLKQTA
ncbi:MAG: helix-turn-helix transcriptional regulator, partial [Balneolaceae bacterium]|nr:helix-turn-helix transcriptional regulator [Balneolaceae bacterium]